MSDMLKNFYWQQKYMSLDYCHCHWHATIILHCKSCGILFGGPSEDVSRPVHHALHKLPIFKSPYINAIYQVSRKKLTVFKGT